MLRHVGFLPTCRVVLDTLADTTSSRVADKTGPCRRHVGDMTQHVAVWATKSTRRHPTNGAKLDCGEGLIFTILATAVYTE